MGDKLAGESLTAQTESAQEGKGLGECLVALSRAPHSLDIILSERSESKDLAPGKVCSHAHLTRDQTLRLRALRALRSG